MKKILTFMATFVLIASVAVAQNNTATSSQTGDENNAFQTQEGSDNLATTTQGMFEGETNSYYATAEQTQKGISNTADIKQRDDGDGGNYSIQYQEGVQNSASALLKKGMNTSAQFQVGNFNQSLIQITAGGNNVATSEQVGESNISEIFQKGSGNTGTVESFGSYNEAYINQTKGGHDDHGDGDDDHHDDEGGCSHDDEGGCGCGDDGEHDDGHSDHGFGKGVHFNEAYIQQVGDNNFAEANQNSNASIMSYRVKGDDNKFWGLQKGKGGHIMDFDLYSIHDGDKNNGNYIHASQRGKENKMWVTIKGDNTNSPDFQFHQRGHGNQIRGFGEGTRFFYEGDQAEHFEVSQRGRMNVTEADIRHGKDIDLTIDQRGQTNYTKVDSRDWSNLIDVTQRCGAGNYTDIYQRNGGSSILDAGNSAIVFQKGDANMSVIHQTQ